MVATHIQKGEMSMGLRDKFHRQKVKERQERQQDPRFISSGTESEVPKPVMKAIGAAPIKIQTMAITAASRFGYGGLARDRFMLEIRMDMAKELETHPEYRSYTVEKVFECYHGQKRWPVIAKAGVSDDDLRDMAREALAVWGNNT